VPIFLSASTFGELNLVMSGICTPVYRLRYAFFAYAMGVPRSLSTGARDHFLLWFFFNFVLSC
jgi:hypothetical protein